MPDSPKSSRAGDSAAPVVAIDLGGTAIKAGRVNPGGVIEARTSRPTQSEAGAQRVLENIAAAAQSVMSKDTRAIALGSPGHVVPATGVVSWIENIACLNGVSLTDALADRFSLPVFIDNDATNATRGEFLFGAGRSAICLLGITLGTGVGGGLIVDGRVMRGVSNYAGEIGHMTYIPDGMACTCGKRGCLEAYASATAIIRSARSIQKRGIRSALLDVPTEDLDARRVCDLAREGDDVSEQIVAEAGKALGVVIGGAINLLNPDRVVIGGGVAAAGKVLLDPIRLYASRHALPLAFDDCRIELGEIGNDAGLVGAAAIAFMEADLPRA